MTLFPSVYPSPMKNEPNETCDKCKAENDSQLDEKQFLNSSSTSKEHKKIMSKNVIAGLCTVALLALFWLVTIRFLYPSAIYGNKDLDNGHFSAKWKNVSPSLEYSNEGMQTDIFGPQRYISNENICSVNGTDGLQLLVLVRSSISNFHRRRTLRRTWRSLTINDGRHRLGFFVGSTINFTEYVLLQKESKKYHDIIQSDFEDTDKNLTLISISMLKWAADFCPHAKLFVRTDDDIYADFEILSNIFCNATYLSDPHSITEFVQAVTSEKGASGKYLVSDDDVPDVFYS